MSNHTPRPRVKESSSAGFFLRSGPHPHSIRVVLYPIVSPLNLTKLLLLMVKLLLDLRGRLPTRLSGETPPFRRKRASSTKCTQRQRLSKCSKIQPYCHRVERSTGGLKDPMLVMYCNVRKAIIMHPYVDSFCHPFMAKVRMV